MPTASPWPDGCQGAVSLTFDDGMTSQLQVAIPMLNEHGLTGTFYLNPRGENWEERLQPWREPARAGHEIGNHTMAHPCSRAFRDSGAPAGLEALTLAELGADIVETQRALRAGIPDAEGGSFWHPR